MPRRTRKPPKVAKPVTYSKARTSVPPIRKRVSVALKEASNVVAYAQTLFDLLYLYQDHQEHLGVNDEERSERIEIANKLRDIREYLDTLSSKVS